MDCARALKAAAKMVEDGVLTVFVEERYAGWNGAEAQKMLDGGFSLSRDRRVGAQGRHQSAAEIRTAGISGECGQPLRLTHGIPDIELTRAAAHADGPPPY
jgi:hypothetical protein